MEDTNTPVDELIFEMKMTLCECFPSLTPFTLRREKAVSVYTLIVKYSKYAKKKKKNDGKPKVIRRPASDNWF